MSCPDDSRPPHSVDSFWRGAFTLVQPRRHGYRSGLDALLVASAVPADAAGRCIDLGAGAGAIGMAAAARAPALHVTLAECAGDMADCAGAGLALPQNAGLSPRIELKRLDVTAPRPRREEEGLRDGGFDFVLTNPPFYPQGHRASPDPLRRQALFVPEPGFLERWFVVAGALARHGGRLVTVLPPAGLPQLLPCIAARFGDIALRPVQTRADAPAGRVLIAARRGSRAPLRLLPALDLSPGSAALRALDQGHLQPDV